MTTYGPWNIWNGGECPVDPCAKVNVQCRGETRVFADGKPDTKAKHYEWNWTDTASDIIAYREVIEPKRETVEKFCHYAVEPEGWMFHTWSFGDETHRVTFDTIDGEPVCDSIRMEKLK